MRIERVLETPWTPYAVMFSRDGTRLAIGGGTWYGGGGIQVVDLASGGLSSFDVRELPRPDLAGEPTISGVHFTGDDRHLLACGWSQRHDDGPALVFEVRGTALALAYGVSAPSRGPHRDGFPTGIVFDASRNRIVMRIHGARSPVRAFQVLARVAIDRSPAPQQLTSSRLVVVDGTAITAAAEGVAGIATIPADSDEPWIHPGVRVSAIAATGAADELVTGSFDGSLALWSRANRWTQLELRGATALEPMFPRHYVPWVTYKPDAIVGVCALAHADRFASVAAAGHLTLFDRGGTIHEQWAPPEPGSPRTLAAHPDGSLLAIGLKAGSRHPGTVLLVDTTLPLAAAWRTPRVVALARAAARAEPPDGDALHVLADALEEVGASAEIAWHLHNHDPRVRRCWIADALR
jgi:hypothetical protein